MKYNLASHPRRDGRGTVESRKRRRWRMQPTLLALEERQLLSTFPVTSTADPATLTAGTLRWAVAQAKAATSPSAIEFELGSGAATITLLQGQLELSNASDATTIYDGPGEGGVSISGNNASRVLQVDSGVTASLSGLTIIGGNAGTSGNGGGLANNGGNLTLTDFTVSGNQAGFGGGGGLYSNSSGHLTLTNSTVSGNSTTGSGGGLFSLGTATLTDCTVSGNTGRSGGGLDCATGTTTLANTIVAANSGGSRPDVSGSFHSLGNNLIGRPPAARVGLALT